MSWKKKTRCLWLLDKLKRENALVIEEYECLTSVKALELVYYAGEHAAEVRKKVYGNEVYIEGLIEIGNSCLGDSCYCGIRRSNINRERYALTKEQILSCCNEGYKWGIRTFVLQSDDGTLPADDVCDIVSDIRRSFPDCAVTLSLGEYTHREYEQMYHAGADRYILRREAADKCHFAKMHPKERFFDNRMSCLRDLRDIGFQTGYCFTVGSPYQTSHTLAENLKFIEEFQPDICTVEPFFSHKDSPSVSFRPESLLQMIYTLSLIRLVRPSILLFVAAAFSCIAEDGRERGIKAGANVVAVNLSPISVHDKYGLHDSKTDRGEIKQELEQLRILTERIGYRTVFDGGEVKRLS